MYHGDLALDADEDTETAVKPQVKPSVSAIVVTFKSGPRLKECLYALCVEKDISEIIVVNHGNDDFHTEWLENFRAPDHVHVEVLTGHGNIGYAAGINLGAKKATGERYLIINPDAVIKYGSISALENARSKRNSPCLVGGKIMYSDGEEQRGGRRELMTPWRAFTTFTGLHVLEKYSQAFRNLHREKDPEPKGPVSMPVISGAFCYLTAEDFKLLGGLDESYFLHVEDIDICRRVWEKGGEVVYTPKASALHYGSTSKVSASFVEWNKAKGLARYFFVNAKTVVGKVFAKLSILAFAPLLLFRSFAIRMLQQVRESLRKLVS